MWSVIGCGYVSQEREWAVLVEVLVGLNNVLEDRKLTISSCPNLSALSNQVCRIVSGCGLGRGLCIFRLIIT